MTDCIDLQLHHTVDTTVTPTQRVCEVASMFGLGVDERKTIEIIPTTSMRLAPGRLIFITGASGGGKTTLLRCVRQQIESRDDVRVIDFDELAVEGAECDVEKALVDALGDSLEDAVRYLSLAGLNDAHVMLRRPGELSDGQRYRWCLARAMAAAERQNSSPLRERLGEGESSSEHSTLTPALSLEGRGGCAGLMVVMADEFGATLDRMTAQIIARNVRKWTRRAGVCVLAATTHDDLLEALEPDVLVVQHPGAGMSVLEK